MVASTFTVFVDTATPQQASSSVPSKPMGKLQRVHQLSDAPPKENINPLTGELCQPPSKKRKPSTSSVLTCKTIASSSKSTLKYSKPSSGKDRKDKGKKRKLIVLDAPDENQEHEFDSAVSSITLLGNRKAYEFTVMPLADVTQAYDESEAFRPFDISDTIKNEVAQTKSVVTLVEDSSASEVKPETETITSQEVVDPHPAQVDEVDA